MAAGFAQSFGFYLDVLGGVALLALAGFVAAVKPRRAVNLAFAGYALGVGLAIVLANLAYILSLGDGAVNWLFVVGIGLGGSFLIAVGLLLDRTVSTRVRPVWPLLLVAALHYPADRILTHALFDFASVPLAENLGREASDVLQALAFGGVWFAVLLAGARTAQGAWTMPTRVTALLAVGLVALPGYDVGIAVGASMAAYRWDLVLLYGLRIVPFLVCGAVWLAAAHRRGRSALVAGLACFLFPTLGVVATQAPPDSALEAFLYEGSFGLVAVVGVGILAYAILRHQMFDIDVKLKWTLRRGTVLGIFAAAFFVVAQLIQAFAGQMFGLVGGAVVAGLLLFALNPLQRLADRFSDKAMPTVRPEDPGYVLAKKRETYRNAYASAWADGNLTQKDMRLLTEFREALGLAEGEYVAIERDWAKAAPKA